MSGGAHGKTDLRTLYERHNFRGVAWGVRKLYGAEGLSEGERDNIRVVAGDRGRVLEDLEVKVVRTVLGVIVIIGECRDLRELSVKVDEQSQDRHSRRQ